MGIRQQQQRPEYFQPDPRKVCSECQGKRCNITDKLPDGCPKLAAN